MISYIKGKLEETFPKSIIVDVRGIAYDINIPMNTYDNLPEIGSEVKILTHLHITENSQTLYGFINEEDRNLFKILIKVVSGVGPKLAISILSGITSNDFKKAVASGDVETLVSINGVGKKTAQRIVLELQDKVDASDVWSSATSDKDSIASDSEKDTFLALIALGYNKNETQKALNNIKKIHSDMSTISTTELIKMTLKQLS